MIVDAHIHVNFMGMSAEDIIARMDRDGVDQCWAMSLEDAAFYRSEGRHPVPADDVLAAAADHPTRIVPFCAPDPSLPDAPERLRRWASRGAAGCAELKVPLRWDAPAVGELLAAADELRMVLVFHMEDFRRRGAAAGPMQGHLLDFDALERRLVEFPRVRFVGHGQLFWKGIASPLDYSCAYPAGPVAAEGVVCRLLAEHPNLCADLSGRSGYNALARDPAFGAAFALRFKRKLLYGTDNADLGLMALLDSFALPADAAGAILGGNACRLLAGRR